MIKFILATTLVIFSAFSYAGSEFDKDITVLNQTRDEKVTTVFKEMMATYEDGDLSAYFTYVSEDRFEQDYMTFYEAIDTDLRTYDVLSIETWVNKITVDGVKRYLYVRWEKRYQSINSDTEINQSGYSRFLFDEINGKYKLVELAGNNFWGGSLPEWKEEVPQIAGQEPEGLPDLTVTIINCVSASGSTTTFTLNNIGEVATNAGSVDYRFDDGVAIPQKYTVDGDIDAGSSTQELTRTSGSPCGTGVLTVDPHSLIEESDESNNQSTF